MMIDALLSWQPCPDRSFWLDRGRRNHRLRRDGDHVIAEHRDGRSFSIPWPADESVAQNEGFAQTIFEIAAKTKTAAEG